MLEAIRTYLLACPLFSNHRIGVDSVQSNETGYALGTMPMDEILRTYVSQSTMRQYVFEITASYLTADTDTQNMENAAAFEALSTWLSQQTKLRNFPTFPDDCTIKKIQAVSNGYFDSTKTSTRLYVMQCRIVYFKKGER